VSSAHFDPLTSSAPLIVYIDYKSPYAYLAKDPTYALEDELGIEVDWRPFTLDIPSYLGSARLNDKGELIESQRTPWQWSMVRYSYRDVRRYASMRGLITRGTTKIWDSSVAAIGMLWAKRQGRTVLRHYSGLVYDRFWKRELDIEDPSVIEAVLHEAGADTAGFKDYLVGEGRLLHDTIQEVAFDAGIFGVPSYVIGGELFFGREHLPRIRWILNGRPGPAPDVAYESEGRLGGKIEGPLAVTIDIRSPTAYLAIAPTIATAEELGVAIDWQPFLVSSKEPGGVSGDDRGTRHRRIRAEYIARDAKRYAADRGLAIHGFSRQRDSTLAAIALLWVRRVAAPLANTFVQRMFDRYWCGGIDIQDETAICRLLAEVGAPTVDFPSYARADGRAELDHVQTELTNAGLFEVPTYILGGEIYVGRQHLPLIRRLLSAGTK
jgi:2-hydroxychromene-2-carboxylate isomerase